MKKLTFWLPDAHAAELEVESRRRNISKSELVRERLGLTRVWRCRSASFDAIADLIGSGDKPAGYSDCTQKAAPPNNRIWEKAACLTLFSCPKRILSLSKAAPAGRA